MNRIGTGKAPALAVLLCALSTSACVSSVGRVSASHAVDSLEKSTIQCEKEVGSLHPRFVIARPLVERCMKRHETMRIRDLLRGIESGGTRS